MTCPLRCPLGLEFCDRKPVLPDAKSFAITWENYFHCRSWVLPWSLPLYRITEVSCDRAAV